MKAEMRQSLVAWSQHNVTFRAMHLAHGGCGRVSIYNIQKEVSWVVVGLAWIAWHTHHNTFICWHKCEMMLGAYNCLHMRNNKNMLDASCANDNHSHLCWKSSPEHWVQARGKPSFHWPAELECQTVCRWSIVADGWTWWWFFHDWPFCTTDVEQQNPSETPVMKGLL